MNAHVLAITLSIVTAAPAAQPNRVTLKLTNGQSFNGTIVNQNANFITLSTDGREIKILRSIIAEIDGRPVDADGRLDTAAPVPADTQPHRPAPTAQTAADTSSRTIRLRNGAVFRGPILKETGAFITVSVDGKPLNVLKSLIGELDGVPYGDSPAVVAESSVSAPAAAAPVQPPASPPPIPVTVPTTRTSDKPAVSMPNAPSSAPPPPASTSPSKQQAAAPPPAESKVSPAAQTDSARTPAGSPPSTAATPAIPTERSAWATDTTDLPKKQDKAAGQVSLQQPPADTARHTQGVSAPIALPPRRSAASSAVAEPPLEFAAEIPAELRPLIVDLDSPDPKRQIAAALQLRDKGPAALSAIPYLIRRFRSTAPVEQSRRERRKHTGDSSEFVLSPARAAAMALVAIGEPAVPHLNRALYHNDAAVRAGVCRTLGELKHGSSLQPLMEMVKDKNDTVRAAAAEAFGKIRDPRTIPLLLTLLSEDESPMVRTVSETALKNLTEIPLLIEGLRDKNPMVQDNAAYILWLMTAKEFGKDAEKWEAWWREQARDSSAARRPSVQTNNR